MNEMAKYTIIDLEDNIVFHDWNKTKTLEKTKINDDDNIKIMRCLKRIINKKGR